MRKKLVANLVVASMAILYVSALPSSSAETTTPKGVSDELWSVFKETATLDLEGERRNFRWRVSPGYFIRGNTTQRDIDTFNNTLYYIASECSNIKPGKTANEP